jgi:hypothetical protein
MKNILLYRPLPPIPAKEGIHNILEKGSKEEQTLLALSIGQNGMDWHYAQDICLKLAESPDEGVRANACLGLAYIARTKGKLEKRFVKPVLLRELRQQTELQWRVVDAIEDINYFMGWNLAHKELSRYREKSLE